MPASTLQQPVELTDAELDMVTGGSEDIFLGGINPQRENGFLTGASYQSDGLGIAITNIVSRSPAASAATGYEEKPTQR